MLTEFIGYYKYQHIIIFYETGDRNFIDKLPMNVRFLGLFLQYLIFKLIPCVKFPVIEIKTLPPDVSASLKSTLVLANSFVHFN